MTDKDSFRAKKLEVLRRFCLFDDAFFSKCLDGGNECVELILSIILGRNDLKVVNTRTRYFCRRWRRQDIRHRNPASRSWCGQEACEVL